MKTFVDCSILLQVLTTLRAVIAEHIDVLRLLTHRVQVLIVQGFIPSCTLGKVGLCALTLGKLPQHGAHMGPRVAVLALDAIHGAIVEPHRPAGN